MKDVFISYKAEEFDEANWVKSTLETNGISCWMAPACIPGGSSYAVEIPQAIRQSKIFVLILSSKAQASQWVSKEIDLAINEGKIVLPFMLENCALKDDFNFYLTNVQRYTAYENKAAAVEKMIREIKALIETNDNTVLEEVKVETVQSTAEAIAKPKIETLSLLSLIFGIIAVVALLGAFIVPNLVAIILSILGIKNVMKKQLSGKGIAITGQILGLVSMLIGLSINFGGIGAIIALIIIAVSLVLFIKGIRKTKG